MRAVLEHGGTDGDGQVHVAVETEIADGAGVDAALGRSSSSMISIARTLGAPVTRAGREGRPSTRRGRARAAAFDVGDDVHHVRVALDHHLLGHRPNRSWRRGRRRCGRGRAACRCSARSFWSASSSAASASSSSGVAPRVRVPAIGRTVTVPSSTRTRISGDAPTTWKSSKSKIEHVRRRVERSAARDRATTATRQTACHALREHHLHDVAVGDVLACARLTAALKAASPNSTRGVHVRRPVCVRDGHRLAQLAPQLREAGARAA